MPLFRLIYSSRRRDSAQDGLDAILRVSRANNRADAITGALVVSEEHFRQVLEGRRLDVTRSFARILRDSRHLDVQLVSAGEVRDRLFPQWTMDRVLALDLPREALEASPVDGLFRPDRLPQERVRRPAGPNPRAWGRRGRWLPPLGLPPSVGDSAGPSGTSAHGGRECGRGTAVGRFS